MPIPLIPIAVAGLALIALRSSSSSSSSTGNDSSSSSSSSSSSGPTMTPSGFVVAPDLTRIAPRHPLELLSDRNDKSVKPRGSGRGGTGEPLHAVFDQVSRYPRYSKRWYKDWAKWMHVQAPFPPQWEHFGDSEVVRWGLDTPGYSLKATGEGGLAWLGPGSAGHFGAPKAFAQEFYAAGAAIGPSPQIGGTVKIWGPWSNLSVKGALKAESLNYWPIDYRPEVDDKSLTEGYRCHRHDDVADLLDLVADVVQFVPYVGSVLSAGIQVAAGAERGEPVTFTDVADIASAANDDFTGLSWKPPTKSDSTKTKEANAAAASEARDELSKETTGKTA